MSVLRSLCSRHMVFIERGIEMIKYYSFVIVLLILGILSCKGKASDRQEGKDMSVNDKNIRHSALAGTWYDADPKRLHATISGYLREAKSFDDLGTIIGLISPHAGYKYSGPVAAYAYKQIEGKSYDTIIVVAPNHGDPRLNFSSVYTRGAYETPLGIIPVDEKIARAIVDFNKVDDVRESDLGHIAQFADRAEHSLEIQLPFLQVGCRRF